MVFFVLLARDVEGRVALFSTIGRLFEGLSDIAKAVLIILIADTLLGYHSEEGWTGLIDVLLGHYGVEVEVRRRYRLVPRGRGAPGRIGSAWCVAGSPPAVGARSSRQAARRTACRVEPGRGTPVLSRARQSACARPPQEKDIVLFVGIIPIAIDVLFKVGGWGHSHRKRGGWGMGDVPMRCLGAPAGCSTSVPHTNA